jgi:anti-anti-sigma regulatory factor
MRPPDPAAIVRPGEHACCRFADRDDRRRAAAALVRDGLRRDHKVVYFVENEDIGGFVGALQEIDADVAPAIASGQLEVRPSRDAYTPDGTFEMERMLTPVHDHGADALVDGYAGLSITGEIGGSLVGAPGAERLDEYERCLDAMDRPNSVLLCQYDHRRFDAGLLSGVADRHDVDLSPELATIGRDGMLAAARVRPGTLRIAGELDFGCASTLAEVLDAHFHGPLTLDLADLHYVDVTGMRALRGRKAQRVMISSASESVRRLVGLLGWDTDPDVEMAVAA